MTKRQRLLNYFSVQEDMFASIWQGETDLLPITNYSLPAETDLGT